MEGCDGQARGIACSAELPDTARHLARRLVRKSRGEDPPGRNPLFFDKVGDPMGHNASFPGTCPRYYQKRSFGSGHCRPLRRIEAFEEGGIQGCNTLPV